MTSNCSRCHAPLGRDVGGGVCTACLLEEALPAAEGFCEPAAEHTLMSDVALVQRFGPYELLEEIGRGGMGVIYKARQPGLDRIVALKMLLAGEFADAKARERLLREARIAARLTHPGIVTIHEVGEHQGRPYFAMEYVPGRNLAQHCRDGLLPVATAVRYVEQLARAVHYAHQHGVIHRDLKPANILISPDDEPKLTDFGLTKSLVDPTQTVESAGSPNFMAPEQADSTLGTTGTPTDIFGLGAILYYLLTGRPPAVGETLSETLRNVVTGEPVAPRQLRPALPRDLETITLRCLEKEPSRRYGSALEVADELARWQRLEPIHARPTTGPERLAKWVRRHPVVAGLSAAVVLSLLIGLGATSWQARRANRATVAAIAAERVARRNAYAADLKAAQISAAQHNRGFAVELLRRYLPAPGEEDLRSIDWRFLWQTLQGNELQTMAHPPMVKGVAPAPNGQWLATAATDGMIRIWDVVTGKQLRAFPGNPVLGFRSLAVLPDGRHLAALSETGIQIRATSDWALERELPIQARLIEFSRDGGRFVTVGREVVCWRVDDWTQQAVAQVAGGIRSDFGCLSLSRDGSLVAFCSSPTKGQWDESIRIYLWKVGDGDPRALNMNTAGNTVSLALSSDGRWLAAGFSNGEVECWDLQANQASIRFRAHPMNTYGLAFSPDGGLLATGGNDHTIRFWKTSDWTCDRTLQGHRKEIWSLNFAPDGRLLASASEDGTAKLWATDTRPAASPAVLLPTNSVPIGILPDDTTLVAEDGLARATQFWDLTEGKLLDICPWNELENIGCAQFRFFPGKAIVVGADGRGTIHLWRLPKREPLGKVELGLTNAVPSEISPDLRWLVAVLPTGRTLLDMKSPGWSRLLPQPTPLQGFSPDSRWFVYVDTAWRFRLWDLTRGEEASSFRGGRGHAAVAFAFSPDGKTMACAGWDADITLWDLTTGTAHSPLQGHLSAVLQVAFSADGRTLVSEGSDSTVRFWNVSTGRETLLLENVKTPSLRDALQGSWRPGELGLTLQDLKGPIQFTPIPSLSDIDQEVGRRAARR